MCHLSISVKVKVLLLFSASSPLPDGFSSVLQPNPWQGTHPTLVWTITLRWSDQTVTHSSALCLSSLYAFASPVVLNTSLNVWCRFLILLVESCSKLVISGTEHLVEVVDKLTTTTVVFFGSERILKCKHVFKAPYKHLHVSILSDLKKTTVVVESLSTTSTRCSVPEITSLLQGILNVFYVLNMFVRALYTHINSWYVSLVHGW